jgi:probable selenium-dependent hydroxylase accessory protein YqeC
MTLLSTLGIARGDVVSIVGAGGKTTLVYRLADEAWRSGMRVLVTTTTHMGTLPEAVTGPVFVEAEADPLPGLDDALRRDGRATLLGRRLRTDKLEGVAPGRVDRLAAHADLVLVEADGARGRSLKLPADHEPVIPSSSTLVIVLAALDVLGAPLTERHVHRLDRVAGACGREPGQSVRAEDVASALRSPAGYAARIGATVRAGVFLNKVEDEASLAAARAIAATLVPPYAFVAAGSAQRGEGLLVTRADAR